MDLTDDGFTAPTESVTITLSPERYNDLIRILAHEAVVHGVDEAAELLDLIDTRWSTFNG